MDVSLANEMQLASPMAMHSLWKAIAQLLDSQPCSHRPPPQLVAGRMLNDKVSNSGNDTSVARQGDREIRSDVLARP